ncbi:MAG: MBL fold metallo-hydrolase [Anaerolineae bacterium]|nr:MBL fold metallo-hydrolase [Anaerolineae bacterium]MCO5187877.1 MBL fold metallo-hydrolase [Anaerolineae bacterium]
MQKMADGVYALTAPKAGYFKAGYTYAFLIESDDGLIVIDTLYDTDARDIIKAIEAIGRKPDEIRHILLTHGHRGHLGGVKVLRDLSGAAVYAHPWEADIITGDRRRQNVSKFNFSPIQTWPIVFVGELTNAMHPPCPVDVLIEGGDKVGPLEAVFTPGHTPGHLVFYWPERKILFAGDALATWPILCPGWDNSSLNMKQSWESLAKMAALDVEIIGPGHGKPILKNGGQIMRDLSARGHV